MSALTRRRTLAVAGGALASALARPVRAQTLLPVHVGASLDDGLTPVLYALKSGLFKKHGLDVTLTAAQNGAALATAVAGGSVDIGKSALMPLINAHLRGIDFKIVAGAVLYVTGALSDGLCSWKNGPITNLTQAVNKTIALATLQSLDQMVTQAYIDQHGGNSTSCRYVEITPGAMMAALEAGRCDLAAIVIPVLQADLDTGKLHLFGNPYDALGKRLLIAGWFCMQDFASKNPEVVRRFGDATRESAAYTNTHHEETVPMIAAYTGIEPDAIRKMHRDVNATDLDPKDIQPVIDAAYKYKYIPSVFDAKDLIVSG